jgi:hypothetical protein
MACRKTAFPSITVISILLLTGSALYTLYLARKRTSQAHPEASPVQEKFPCGGKGLL